MRLFSLLATIAALVLFVEASFAQSLPPGYDVAYNAARNTNKPLAVFVNCDNARSLFGSVAMECKRFPGVVGSGIVVGVPDPNGGDYLRYDLPADATDVEIRKFFPLPSRSAVTRAAVYRDYFPTQPVYTPPAVYIDRRPLGTPINYEPHYPFGSPGVGVYGGIQAGPIGLYGGVGGCPNGQCSPR